ncbi:MMPL family transporter [Kurthia zopfii]|uniref:MMPL family transporter n=1 Tax=Kurthia zopfii TaxID=1650 RepID=UPI000F6F9C4B|nr:MMPL family transporter [Kurthia zopfii]VEI05221.1 Putative membrane protein ydgH [Kurthia zopfii]
MKKHPFEAWGQLVASKKSRWITLVFWVLLVVVLSFTMPQINSIDNKNAENLPESSASLQAAKVIDENFPDNSGIPLLLVWHRDGGLKSTDYAEIQKLYQSLESEPVKEQSLVPPLSKVPPQQLQATASENGSTIVTPVFFNENATTDALSKGVDEIEKVVADLNVKTTGNYEDAKNLSLRYSGPVGISLDATGLFKNADFKLMGATVLLVLVLLILIYRSPLLAIIPLVAVGMAYGVISPLLGFMAEHGWIDKDAQAVSIMTVLLFGAGTDYCLFLISKYREVLLKVENQFDAMKQAMKESGGAIMMSALTVVLGLATLALANYGAFERFAVPFSFGVLLMGFTALIVLPALLVIFGRVAFYPFVPRTEKLAQEYAEKKNKPAKRHEPKHKYGKKIGHFVTSKPWTVILATIIVLGGLASFTPKIQYTFDLLSSFPEDTSSREGFTLIEENFSAGELAPMKVVVDTKAEGLNLQKQLTDLKEIESVKEPQQSKENKNLQLYEVSLKENPYSPEALQAVPKIKKEVQSLVEKETGEKAKVWVGGETASQYDEMKTIERDESVIMPAMIALIALLLFVYLRSITATFYLVATVVLSYGAALGAGWIVLHYIMGVDAIQGSIPLYAFVFLVALGEDYNIFMISEIWKNRKEGKPHKLAIQEGVIHTGSVITSAGLILAGTFAVLGTLPIQVLVQFGIVTALGILMDTFIVRPLLVPALTTVLGKYAYWPGKLFKKG